MRIGLVCSGGGHLRQLLALRGFWGRHATFLLSPKTALSESDLGLEWIPLPDFAMGTLRRSPLAWGRLAVNAGRALWILSRKQPHLVLSTGAGAALPTLVAARILGIPTVFIETLAHVVTPSGSGRAAKRLADRLYIQWPELVSFYPQGICIETLRPADPTLSRLSRDRPLTLVTVGTHGPFDRLLEEVDRLILEGALTGPVMAQIGPSAFKSPRIETFTQRSSQEMNGLLEKASLVIAHGGTGSILSALEAGCKVVAIARSAQGGEHYDDHQLEILRALIDRGAILGGERPSDLRALLEQAGRFEPQSLVYDPSPLVVDLEEWSHSQSFEV